jgi:exosortase/archaeosortase family protein
VSSSLVAYFSGKRYTELFVVSLLAVLFVPYAIPTVTVNETWVFVLGLTLFAWLIIKWEAVVSLTKRSNMLEFVGGIGVVVAIMAENFALHKEFGLIDMTVAVAAVVVAFYGFRSWRFFVVPALYLVILIGGYQLESSLPEFTGLEIWEAALMANFMSTIGVNTTVNGNIVTLAGSAGFISLEVASACTGIKGILAFGMLSSMAVLDIKVSVKRLILILSIGFIGVFFMDLVRLAVIFLSFYYLGISAGEVVHIYLGYAVFIVWVIAYWGISFKYLIPHPAHTSAQLASTTSPGPSLK